MVKPTYSVSFFCFLLIIFSANAQPILKTHKNIENQGFTLQAQQARQYVFSHFSSTNGLSSNQVNNIIQDYKGFIWLASNNGLQRYDGNRFITFKNTPEKPQSLPDNNIAWVYEDKKRNLWLLTSDNKIGIFNTYSFTYKEIPIQYPVRSTVYFHKQFIETTNGELFIFMGSYGLYQFDPKAVIFNRADNVIPLPKGWSRNSLVFDSTDNLFWMGGDSGIAVFNPVSRYLSYRGHNMDKNPVIAEFQSLQFAAGIHADENRFLFFTWPINKGEPTLHYFNRKRKERRDHRLSVEAGLGYHEIVGSILQKNGRLWIYGKPFILEYTEGETPFQLIRNEYKNEQSIKFDYALNMYEDREHNLWIATNNGVFLFNPDAQLFNSYHLLRPDGTGVIEGPTQTTLELKNGQTWIGCWGIGLYCYDKNFTPIPVPPGLRSIQNTASIWSMLQHSSTGLIWLGLQGGGLIVYNPITDKAENFSPSLFEGKTIRQITEDKQGNVWFGTHGGHVIKWNIIDAKNDPHKGYRLVAKQGIVHKLFIDKEGYLWVGTVGQGLFKINPANNRMIDHFKRDGAPGRQLWNDIVYDIIQINNDTLLAAGEAINMINTKTKRIIVISTEDGLPGNNVQCLQKDKNGIIWLGTTNGLCRFNLEVGTFIMYDRRDGISYDIFLPAAAFRLSDGKLIFNTDHNFLVFDPGKFVQSVVPPDVHITDFKVGNESFSIDSISMLDKIVLDYNKNSITIEFSALNFLKQNKLHYHYQLEGLEKQWQEGSDAGIAIYNYLPPGNYKFKVLSENADALSSLHTVALQIKVKAPFWKTWWFYGFLVLLLAAVFYWIDRERASRSFAMQKIRSEIAGNLHEEVSTTLNNISLLSEMAKIKADKDIDRSKEYIDQINDKSRRMIDAMDDMVWSIDPENDNMKKTIARMKEYAEGFQQTYGLVIDLQVEEKVEKLRLDMKTRHELFIIFKDALNCLTHTFKASSATITIDLEKSRLALKLQAGKLRATSKSVNNCAYLADINVRAAKINALLDIHYDRKLTSVILQVPVG